MGDVEFNMWQNNMLAKNLMLISSMNSNTNVLFLRMGIIDLEEFKKREEEIDEHFKKQYEDRRIKISLIN